MSIYIKGMEMPKEGTVFVIDSSGQVWSNKWPTKGYTRLDGVTAVPIPPHGRLIDADAFITQKTELICENCDRRRGMKDGKLTKRFVYAIGDAPCRACDTGDMLDYVDDAPTIIPADEPFGKSEQLNL